MPAQRGPLLSSCQVMSHVFRLGWDPTTNNHIATGDLSSAPHSVTCQQVAEWRRRSAKWWIRQQPLRMPQVQEGRRSYCLASPPTTGRAGSTTLGTHGRCGSDAALDRLSRHHTSVMWEWRRGCRAVAGIVVESSFELWKVHHLQFQRVLHALITQDRSFFEILRWAKWRRDTNQPPRGWLCGNLQPTPADYAKTFPVNAIDWHALAHPPGRCLPPSACRRNSTGPAHRCGADDQVYPHAESNPAVQK